MTLILGNKSLFLKLMNSGGGANSINWGQIKGNLSSQTDLQTALNAKENTITAGTISQYYRGDKKWITLDKTAIGLSNVDNTSDLNKPISTATQSALNLKANTIDVNTSLSLKADIANVYNKTDINNNFYNKTSSDNLLNIKADKSTTYTKDEVNNSLNTKLSIAKLKAGNNITITPNTTSGEITISSTGGGSSNWGSIGGDIENQTDLKAKLDLKADIANVYNKTDINNNFYNKTSSDNLLNIKADKSTTYTKDEVNNSLNTKLSIAKLKAGNNITITPNTTSGEITISSTGVDWGQIKGNLSSQTDLQTALNAKENTITAGTTAQYYRGDKTFQTLDKNAVGLSNVDNTSDINKPISTATQTALDLKGSVANVSITSNNGITSSIINSSTTPTITLGLGNIAPTSVNSTGSITGLNLSGTNTGDETKSSIETKLGVSIVNVINTEGDLSTQVPTAEAILNEFNPAILNLEQQINLKEDKANKGIANGYAGLDATGKVPFTQLPSIASSIANLSDVNLTNLSGSEVLVYNSSLTKWENKHIENLTSGELTPIGSIVAYYGGGEIPKGWLLCDGSQFDITEYPALHNFLNSHILPDLRGYFLRGLGGVDPELGRTIGSIQEDEFKSHKHELPVDTLGHEDTQSLMDNGGDDEGFAIDPLKKVYTSSVGGVETRPKNIAVNYIIKAKHNPASAYNLVAGTDISITTNEVDKTATISSTGYTNSQIDTALDLKANTIDVNRSLTNVNLNINALKQVFDPKNIFINPLNGVDNDSDPEMAFGTFEKPFKTITFALTKITHKGTIYVKGSASLASTDLNIDLQGKEVSIIGLSSPSALSFKTLTISVSTGFVYLENCMIETLDCSSGLTLANSIITKEVKIYGAGKEVKFANVDYSLVPKNKFTLGYKYTIQGETDILGGVLNILPDCLGFQPNINNKIEDVYAIVNSGTTSATLTSSLLSNDYKFWNRISIVKSTDNEYGFYFVKEDGSNSEDIISKLKTFAQMFDNTLIFCVEKTNYTNATTNEGQSFWKMKIDGNSISISKIKSFWEINAQFADTGKSGLISNDDYQNLIYLRSVVNISKTAAYQEESLEIQSGYKDRYKFEIMAKMSSIKILPPEDVNKNLENDKYVGLMVYLPDLLNAERNSSEYDQDVYTIILAKNKFGVEGLTINLPNNSDIKMHNGDGFVTHYNLLGADSLTSVGASFKWIDPNPSLLKIRQIIWELQE
jgi:hypothetical protein